MNRAHLIDRARARYGILLTDADLAEIMATIATAPLISRNPEGGEIRLVMVRGTAMKACWTPELKRLTTFLPKGAHALTGARAGEPANTDDIRRSGRQAALRKKRKPY